MKELIYVMEGHSDGKNLPKGCASRRKGDRAKEYDKCVKGEQGSDWRKCFPLFDCAVQAIIEEVKKRSEKNGLCKVSFIVPPGEADSYLAAMAKDDCNIVCVDSNDGDIGTLFFNKSDTATLHYKCQWVVPAVNGKEKVHLRSKITTPADVYSDKLMYLSSKNGTPPVMIKFSEWDKIKMMAFCISVSTNGDYCGGKLHVYIIGLV